MPEFCLSLRHCEGHVGGITEWGASLKMEIPKKGREREVDPKRLKNTVFKLEFSMVEYLSGPQGEYFKSI